MTEPAHSIQAAVRAVRRRVRVQQAAVAAAIALPLAGGVLVAARIVRRAGVPPLPVVLALAALLLGGAGFVLWRSLRRTRPFDVARAIDARAVLADRTASGLEFASLAAPTEFHAAQLRDAEKSLDGKDLAAFFPFPGRLAGKRFGQAAAAAIAVALVAFAAVRLPALFGKTPQQKADEEFARTEGQGETPALSEVALPEEVLQLVRPAEEIIARWKERLRQIEEQRAGQAPEPQPEETAPEQRTLPETVVEQLRVRDLGTPSAIPAQLDLARQQVRISDLSALVDKKADAEYAEAFAYLDKKVFGDGPKLLDVEKFAESMKKQAEKQKQGGLLERLSSAFAAGGENPVDGGNQRGALENQVQGAMAESMAEFLAEYSAHLARLSEKMRSIVEQMAAGQKQPKQQISIEERIRLAQESGNPATRIPMKDLTEKDLKEGRIRALSPEESGSSAAGYGLGTAEGAFKVPKVERQATEYAELDSEFGEGRTVQILEDLEGGDATKYAGLFRGYALSAESLLADEDIPAVIKNFVREYFLAISPKNVTK
jgi:hypothetical protein